MSRQTGRIPPPSGTTAAIPSPPAAPDAPGRSPGGQSEVPRTIRPRLAAAWETVRRMAAADLVLLRALAPDAAPDLSTATVARWPVCPEAEGPPHPLRGTSREAAPPRPFDLVLSLFPYENEVRAGIRAVKYGGRSDGARVLARRLFEALRGEWADRFPAAYRPTIVPVPIRPRKYLRRGYNVAALFAVPLGRMTGWPCDLLLLRRIRESRAQAGLPLGAREENVQGAFAVRPGARSPSRVLLVDDVYTSGATAGACARALKEVGAEHIVVLTAARALA